MAIALLTHALNVQSDVVGARQRAREIASMLGFAERDQTRISTSVSEIARNAFRYAGGGKVEFALEGDAAPQALMITVTDDGPGIPNLEQIMDGTYRSKTGLGIGLVGSRRLMDRWEIHSSTAGTRVAIGMVLPPESVPVTPLTAGKLLASLATLPNSTSLAEVQTQNGELLATLAELQEKQDKLVELTRELDDTNRGVVALYAELDEKAVDLRCADEMKTRFLSHMSHEFRTPLNSVRALCGLLLSSDDGPLHPEQVTQIQFIAKATEDLAELVDDLLDLAKIEAGKVEVRPVRFGADELFSALRGMLRPLLVSDSVELVFEPPAGVPPLFTDESKVSQILRNFVSNALKFTERGAVTVGARLADDGVSVVFSVSDTGIGIAPEDIELIFEEFSQVPSPLQRRVKGTGLGLPLCRRLALLLGGGVSVESTPGKGSTFVARLPLRFKGAEAPEQVAPEPDRAAVRAGERVALIIDDDEASRYLIRRAIREPMKFAEARDGVTGLAMASRVRPGVIFLDLSMPGMRGDEVLDRLRDDPQTAGIPVIVVTSHDIDATLRSRLEEHALVILHKSDLSAAALADALEIVDRPRVP